jgi:hypothetical protein
VQEDPQKDITEYAVKESKEVNVVNNDAEAYEMMTMDEEIYLNGQ